MARTNTLASHSDAKVKEKLLDTLAKIGDGTFSADQGIAYHTDPKNKISLPEGMTPSKGAAVLNDVAAALAQTEVFTRIFRYRPFDGAHAVTQVMSRLFGTTGRGVPIRTMFGSIPPQQIEIEVGPHETTQVPWGHIKFEHFDGTLMLGANEDPEYGPLFQLQLECPKIHGSAVTGFFKLIEDELEKNSIYKGKSIREKKGAPGDGLTFMDLQPNPTIVYNDDVYAKLRNTVWGVIENADLFRRDKRKINKRSLLHGPYGTGKSEAGVMTAGIANANGWTFIQFHSGKGTLDDLESTINTARLYQPAVVFVEDVDVYAGKEDESYQTRLSNLFDGVGSKSDQVMLVMTSNKTASFSKAMLRAGRVDAMIEVGPLDKNATEKMIRLVIGDDRLDTTIDFEAIHAAMDDYEPAFVRLTFDQAAEAAIIRNRSLDYVLGTQDFVDAANLLRPQHQLHRDKSDAASIVTFDTVFRKAVQEAVQSVKGDVSIDVDDWEGEMTFSEKVVN